MGFLQVLQHVSHLNRQHEYCYDYVQNKKADIKANLFFTRQVESTKA